MNTSDITVSAPLAEKGKPEPRASSVSEQNNQTSQEASSEIDRDIRFNIAILEEDTKKPISNVKFTLVYKGNAKQHITNMQGIKSDIIAEQGNTIQVCVAGEGNLQPIASFPVTESLRDKTKDILLPIHIFTIMTIDEQGKAVSNAQFSIFYRGIERVKKTDINGQIKVKMLVGFVYGFGVGKPTQYARCLRSVSVKKIAVSQSDVKTSQVRSPVVSVGTKYAMQAINAVNSR